MKATDGFKQYLNSIINKIDDEIHNELWNKLLDVIMEHQNELSKLHQPAVISSVCVSCDEQKETHELCMDCVKKMIKENQQTDL